MYIQITDHCNMSCAHCLFSCSSSKRGTFMHKDTFLRVLKFAEERGMYITLGGGEPTLHPKFWEFLGLALAGDFEEGGIWMATNGSVTKAALALAKLAKSGAIGCALSQDEWHDPIDPVVVSAFKDLEVRNVSGRVVNKGAAFDNGIADRDGCGCNDTFVNPNGEVYMCGCPDSLKLGGLEVLQNDALFKRLREVGEDTDDCGGNLTDAQRDYILGLVSELEHAA